MKMDELFMNVGNFFFGEKLNKNNRVENIYVGLFLNFLTHEMLKSYFKSYFVFFQYEVY